MSKYINPYTDFGFKKLFGEEVANLTPLQRDEYEQSRLHYLGVKAAVDTAEMDGRKKGRLEGKIEEKLEIAENLKMAGVDREIIKKTTGLSDEEIDRL